MVQYRLLSTAHESFIRPTYHLSYDMYMYDTYMYDMYIFSPSNLSPIACDVFSPPDFSYSRISYFTDDRIFPFPFSPFPASR